MIWPKQWYWYSLHSWKTWGG